VWRIRYALAHKGLSFESIPIGFTEIPEVFGGRFKTVPVICHGHTMLAESWDIAEYLDRAFPSQPPYFRQSREGFLKGTSLEEFTADRTQHLPALREALKPLRSHLSHHPFLGGSTPNYADYIALGAFHWVASVSTLPLLSPGDDALRRWLDRGLDLYDGLGRDSRMKPLFE
jgi:glutathione S-transferase